MARRRRYACYYTPIGFAAAISMALLRFAFRHTPPAAYGMAATFSR